MANNFRPWSRRGPGIAPLPTALVLAFLAGFAALTSNHGKAEEARQNGVRQPQERVVLGEGLVLPPVGRYGRFPVHKDALEAQIVGGKWTAPKAGDTVELTDGNTVKWEPVTANKDGAFTHASLRGGYVYFAVPAKETQVMVLEAAGHTMAYVNGEPRGGDPYGHGYVHLPILLRQGTNHLLFHVARGTLRASLATPKTAVSLDLSDATVPDLIVGEAVDTWAAVLVLNATTHAQDQLQLQAACAGAAPVLTKLPPIPPLSMCKIGFPLQGPPPKKDGQYIVELQLRRRLPHPSLPEPGGGGGGGDPLHSASLTLDVRRPEQTHKRTFISSIDGSVQYYALVPAQASGGHRPPDDRSKPGLVLTLHGAAVEAVGQARAYAPKTWAHIVAPTNRRPYGFDWEDWGRLDALEVLALAQQQLDTDPRRTYLTGHSMGGHGVWHIGVTFPDRFAAIGPSAGWISMWSYAGARRPERPDTVQEVLLRAALPSDTLALARNCAQQGVYILHGEKDDNVPVEQARVMKKELSAFHRDLQYHEEPSVGHWWAKAGIRGTACVDWPPMFDFFKRHAIPKEEAVREVDFRTASPGVSARCHWVIIEAQLHPLKLSSVRLRYDPEKQAFTGTTENVARLALDLGRLPPGKSIRAELDGQKIEDIPRPAGSDRIDGAERERPDESGRHKLVWFTRRDGKWAVAAKPSPALKGPQRYGPFKEAFRNRMLLVYGTRGTPEENAWAFAKARYDAETFWYRGNASCDIIADKSLDPSADRDRSVILYGHADSHGAWKALLADSPVQVRRGRVSVGGREENGDDLACLFLRPRPGSDRALVGVVAGSGLAGMRLTDRLPYFLSGVSYPDCLVLGPETLLQGEAAVRAAGFFGVDWSVPSGDFAWRK